MIYPQNLCKGDKVGVTATSAGCETAADLTALESGIQHFHELGYPVRETKNVRSFYKGRSSDGPQRAKELCQLFEDEDVKVVIAAHGGDYLVEMLPNIDFDMIRKHPKWVQGYSDMTSLLFIITTNLDIATIYAYNFSSFGMERWHKSLEDNLSILAGSDIIQESFEWYQDGYVEKVTGLEEFKQDKKVEWKNLHPVNDNDNGITLNVMNDNDNGVILKGRILGGCLDVLLNLVGTRFDKTREFIRKYRQDSILWFLESFDLGSEALIKGLWQLKEAGWFANASGFVFGRPAMYHTSTDTTYEEAVLSVLGELNLPIILDTDIGHKPPQFALINGAIAEVRSKGGKGSIIFGRR